MKIHFIPFIAMCAIVSTSITNLKASDGSPFESPLQGIMKTPSPNHTARKPRAIILHYTAGSTDASLKWLTTPNTVSAHYCLTPEGEIHQLVREQDRAWHSGKAFWRGHQDINSESIGIEIVGFGFDGEHVPNDCERDHLIQVPGSSKHWFPFTAQQIERASTLIGDIQTRYNIPPHMILGHSDVAPGRKVDPGPLFPWEGLYRNYGLGAWPDFDRPLNCVNIPQDVSAQWVQKHLRDYGYGINITGEFDHQTTMTLQAFQMHFRPSNISGQTDEETITILAHLVDQYHYQDI